MYGMLKVMLHDIHLIIFLSVFCNSNNNAWLLKQIYHRSLVGSDKDFILLLILIIRQNFIAGLANTK